MMIFKDGQHRKFFEDNLDRAKAGQDVYHRALFYTLGLTEETRTNLHDLYDFAGQEIMVEGVHSGWQTATSRRVTRLAFNLFNGYHGGVELDDDAGHYTIEDIFCDSLMVYFFEAIKLRYSEYYQGA
jgi:hypothetical protein